MKRLAKPSQHLLVLSLVLTAIFTGLARLILPQIDLRPELEQMAEQALGAKVTLERVKLKWQGFGPKVYLEGVRLASRDAKRPPLYLGRLQVGLGTWSSLLKGEPVVETLSLLNARVRLQRHPDGHIGLLGLSVDNEREADATPANFDLAELPAGLGLVNADILLYSTQGKPPLHLQKVNLRLRRSDEDLNLQFQGQLAAVGSVSPRLTALLHLKGEPKQWGQLNADFYVQGEELPLHSLLSHFLSTELTLQGDLGLRLWGRIESGTLVELEGETHLEAFALHRQVDKLSLAYNLNQVSGQFRWRDHGSDWQLQVASLKLRRQGIDWPASAITLRGWREQGRLARLAGGARFLRLEDVLGILQLAPPQEKEQLLTWLQQAQPSGDVKNLTFHAELEPALHWQVETSVDQLATRAWQEVPALSGLNLHVRADDQGGVADIQGKEMNLVFANDFFRHPLNIRQLALPLQWKHYPQGWYLGSKQLRLDTADFATRTGFNLSLSNGGQPYLELESQIENVAVDRIYRYLPAGVMKDRLEHWIENALVAGRVSQASVFFEGPPLDFPFDERPSGRFEATLDVEGVTLKYQDEWPPLKEAKAELRFVNNTFTGLVKEARIGQSQVKGIRAFIPQMDPAEPLELEGRVVGPLADELMVLTDTPLKKRFGERAAGIEGRGQAELAIHLVEPLNSDDPRESRVQGQLTFNNSGLAMPKWQLVLEQINGQLHFDDQGVWAEGIQTQSLGSKLSIDVLMPKKGPKRTEIHAKGRLAVKTLTDHFADMHFPHIQGSSEWQLVLDIPHSRLKPKASTQLHLKSDLKGVAIDLPAPLGKSSKAARSFRLDLTPTDSDKPMPIRVHLGDQADAYLEFQKKQGKRELARGEIRLGGTKAKRPEKPGLAVRGRLSRFQLDPWVNTVSRGGSRGGESVTLGDLPRVDAHFGRFEYQGMAFDDIRIQGAPKDGGWQAMLDSPAIKGRLSLPADLHLGRVRLDLDHFVINTKRSGGKKSRSDPSRSDPRGLPGIDISGRRLTCNGQSLGRFKLRADPVKDGLRFSILRLDSDWMQLDGEGYWRYRSPYPQAGASFYAKVKRMGHLQRAITGEADIKEAPGTIRADLRWPGAPSDVGNLELSGWLNLDLGKGRLEEVDPGAGGRLFGLLNLGALTRRLSLDFSDLFGKGFAFDKIAGRFELESGLAYTNNLNIDAPTGVIRVRGDAHLVKRTYDQRVEVTPDLTGAVATAGVVAGGPVVGAVLFAANKVVGKEVNKVSTFHYRIKGPWENPKILDKDGRPLKTRKVESKPFDIHNRN